MKDFFIGSGGNKLFSYFCLEHLVIMVLFFIILGLIVIFRKNIYLIKQRNKKVIKWSGIFIILLFHLVYRFSLVYYNLFDIYNHLDLYYCYITMYLVLLSLVINSDKLFKISFPLVFMGPFMNVLFPSIKGFMYTLPFYHCFVTHNFLILFSLFVFYMKGDKLSLRDCLKSFLFAQMIMLFVYLINCFCGFSYNSLKGLVSEAMFLRIYNLFDGYILILYEVICVFGIVISYILGRFNKNQVNLFLCRK